MICWFETFWLFQCVLLCLSLDFALVCVLYMVYVATLETVRLTRAPPPEVPAPQHDPNVWMRLPERVDTPAAMHGGSDSDTDKED